MSIWCDPIYRRSLISLSLILFFIFSLISLFLLARIVYTAFPILLPSVYTRQHDETLSFGYLLPQRVLLFFTLCVVSYNLIIFSYLVSLFPIHTLLLQLLPSLIGVYTRRSLHILPNFRVVRRFRALGCLFSTHV